MTKITNIHALRYDYRIKSLDSVIQGLKKSVEVLESNITDIHWYDGDWLLEESEPIIGLALIAFQNYINASIKDFPEPGKAKDEFYKQCKNSQGLPRTKIELIIALANYSKHKDDGVPFRGTKEILDAFQLNYTNILYLDNSAIFQGLSILEKDWDLEKIKDLVVDWRENMWISGGHP